MQPQNQIGVQQLVTSQTLQPSAPQLPVATPDPYSLGPVYSSQQASQTRSQSHVNSPASDSRPPSPAFMQQHKEANRQITPPMSEHSRSSKQVDRSYDTGSPWNPITVSSRASSSRAPSASGNSSHGRSKDSPTGGPELAGDGVQPVNRSNAKPIPGVSRSYKLVPRAGALAYGDGEVELGRPLGLEQDLGGIEEYGNTPSPQEQPIPAGPFPPVLSVQPPTPLREEKERNPLDQQASRLADVKEEDAPVIMPDGGIQQSQHVPERSNGVLPSSVYEDNVAAQSSMPDNGPVVGSAIPPPPPPADPSTPAYLKWDHKTQRWVPSATGPTPVLEAPDHQRTSSQVSSTSEYSQQSAPLSTHLQTAVAPLQPLQPIRKSMTAGAIGPSPLINPASAPHSRSQSVDDHNVNLAPIVTSTDAYGGARMAIEPAYQLSPNKLTFLPEMEGPDNQGRRQSTSDHYRSQPSSRTPSMRNERTSPYPDTLRSRPTSSTNLASPTSRPVQNFPTGYDPNQRISMFSSSTRAGSDQGDYNDEYGSRYKANHHRARSMGSSPQMQYIPGETNGTEQSWIRPEQLDDTPAGAYAAKYGGDEYDDYKYVLSFLVVKSVKPPTDLHSTCPWPITAITRQLTSTVGATARPHPPCPASLLLVTAAHVKECPFRLSYVRIKPHPPRCKSKRLLR